MAKYMAYFFVFLLVAAMVADTEEKKLTKLAKLAMLGKLAKLGKVAKLAVVAKLPKVVALKKLGAKKAVALVALKKLTKLKKAAKVAKLVALKKLPKLKKIKKVVAVGAIGGALLAKKHFKVHPVPVKAQYKAYTPVYHRQYAPAIIGQHQYQQQVAYQRPLLDLPSKTTFEHQMPVVEQMPVKAPLVQKVEMTQQQQYDSVKKA